jgi:hypothetical protein
MAQTPEEIVEICIKNKVFNSDMLYKNELLDLFINTIRERKISGPFRKSMFTKHSSIMRRFKEHGITLMFNRKRRNYYVKNEEFYEIPEPVTFDPDLLYLNNIES